MPARKLSTPPDEIAARERAELDALESRTASPIDKTGRLDDPRLAGQRILIERSRATVASIDDVLPSLVELSAAMHGKPIPTEMHPTALRLKAKQEAAAPSTRDLIANALAYQEAGRLVPAHVALVNAARMFEAIFPADPVREPPAETAEPPEPPQPAEPTKLARAIAAIRQNGINKSNRALAAEIGVSEQIVRRAWKQIAAEQDHGAPDGAPDMIMGRDGKTYPRTKARERQEGEPGLIAELFPKGSPACDTDWEAEALKPGAGSFQQRNAMNHQMREALRYADPDFSAVLNPTARITKADDKMMGKIIRAWIELRKLAAQKRARDRRRGK